ncbi:MAG: caspase family protein [Alphaproteobacteria bacterium]|nr:caspase family protein [Alphaproteobacteria bacterium]
MSRLSRIFPLLVACAIPCAALAQPLSRDIGVGQQNELAAPTGAERRIALVIGNSSYKTAPLPNPVNDARAMAGKLEKMGFEVILKENAGQRDMNRAATQFGQKLSKGGVGLFYYAGHGVQVKGRNYLVPVDAMISSESSVHSESVDVDQVLQQLTGARLSVVILDACRNNPFERSFRGYAGGLAQIDAPKGTFIAYATAPGKVASDGEGGNGLYTRELLKTLDMPGLRVEDIFKRVRIQVARVTNDMQIPWEASSLTGDFYFTQPAEIGAMPLPPTGSAFSLEDLKKQEKAAQAGWKRWQGEMKTAYDEAAKFSGPPDLKLAAWDRFLTSFDQDNPYSSDDETLRSKASTSKAALEKNQPLAMKQDFKEEAPPQPQQQVAAAPPPAIKQEAKTLSGNTLGYYQWAETPVAMSRIGTSSAWPFSLRKVEQSQLPDRVQERIFFKEGGFLFYEELYFGGFRFEPMDKLLVDFFSVVFKERGIPLESAGTSAYRHNNRDITQLSASNSRETCLAMVTFDKTSLVEGPYNSPGNKSLFGIRCVENSSPELSALSKRMLQVAQNVVFEKGGRNFALAADGAQRH